MRVQDIMSKSVKTVEAETPVALAREKMQQEHIHHLVVTQGRSLVGVVSTRDLERAPEVRGQTVGALVAAPPVTAEAKMYVRDAANLLRGRSIGCLPVVQGGKVVGIVTMADLMHLMHQGATSIMAGRVDHQPHHRVGRRPNRSSTRM